jgi:hypothetical protein
MQTVMQEEVQVNGEQSGLQFTGDVAAPQTV